MVRAVAHVTYDALDKLGALMAALVFLLLFFQNHFLFSADIRLQD